MLLLRRVATRLGSSSSSINGIRHALPARAMTASAAGGGGGRKEEQEDSSSGSSDIDRERDPFGFRELKAKYGSGAKGGGDPDFPPVTADEAAAVEERLVSAGAVHVERNIFGVEKVTQEMAAGWEAGLLPPQLHARDTDQLMNRHMEGPEDLYWPGHTETTLPREEEQLYPQPGNGRRVYSPEEMREMAEAEVGGVCAGKRQRRGNQPLLCRKVDLEEVAFSNVALLARFLSPAGMIKPRKTSGLCAKCQRKVARTIKQARHLGVIPHTMGVELYKRMEGVGEGNGAGVPLSRPGGAGVGDDGDVKRRAALKRVPAVTI